MSELGIDIVLIFVGPEKKVYSVHKDLICSKIPFFGKAFQGTFNEALTGRMHLPDVSSQAFDLIVYWLYHDTLPHKIYHKSEEYDTNVEDIDAELQVYIAAESWCSVSLQNTFMDYIVDALNEAQLYYGIQAINAVYRHTHANSPIRKFLVARIAHATHGPEAKSAVMDFVEAQGNTLRIDLAVDILRAFLVVNDATPDPCLDSTKWHVPSGEKDHEDPQLEDNTADEEKTEGEPEVDNDVATA